MLLEFFVRLRTTKGRQWEEQAKERCVGGTLRCCRKGRCLGGVSSTDQVWMADDTASSAGHKTALDQVTFPGLPGHPYLYINGPVTVFCLWSSLQSA